MKLKKEWFEQVIINWVTDDKRRKMESRSIEGLKNVLFICSKTKTASRCNVYYNIASKQVAFRIGDFYSEIVEEETRKCTTPLKTIYPVTLDEIEDVAKRTNRLDREQLQKLIEFKKKFPQKRLGALLDYGEKAETAKIEKECFKLLEKQSKSLENKPQIVAGASNAVEKTVTVIDPLKEIKLKNLEQELELIDLKIRKCEILKEISTLKNG